MEKEVILHEIRVFENYEIESVEEGHVIIKTKVTPHSLNYYGNAHGGYLFTLCDQISGVTCRTTGAHAVTLQSNVNYLKAGHLGDELRIEGKIIHNGRTTKVIDTLVKNESGDIVIKASFTMFVTGDVEGD